MGVFVVSLHAVCKTTLSDVIRPLRPPSPNQKFSAGATIISGYLRELFSDAFACCGKKKKKRDECVSFRRECTFFAITLRKVTASGGQPHQALQKMTTAREPGLGGSFGRGGPFPGPGHVKRRQTGHMEQTGLGGAGCEAAHWARAVKQSPPSASAPVIALAAEKYPPPSLRGKVGTLTHFPRYNP